MELRWRSGVEVEVQSWGGGVEEWRKAEKWRRWRSGGVGECDGVQSVTGSGVRSVTEFRV